MKNRKYKRWIGMMTGLLLSCGVCSQVSQAALLHASSVRSDRYGDDGSEKDYVNRGPGVAPTVEEPVDTQTGPKNVEVNLSETYHEAFGTYELNFRNTYFLYSTVKNGGITDQGVRIDIPSGLAYTMEKDGVEMAYASGEMVSARGTYVLRLTGAEDESLPFSEQTYYKAVFRFRIQEKLPGNEETTAGGRSGIPSWSGSGLSGAGDAGNGFGNAAAGESGTNGSGTGADGADTGEAGVNGADTGEAGINGTGMDETGTDGTGLENLPGDYILEDGTYNQEALDAMMAEVIGEETTGVQIPDGYCPANGMVQTYDSRMQLYNYQLLTGSSFYANIPNGMVTGGPVQVRDAAAGLNFEVYRDGEMFTYTPGEDIREAGSYTVLPTEEGTAYLLGYQGKQPPAFRFRIVAGPVNDMGVFAAPQGTKIEELWLDEEQLDGAVAADGSHAVLALDGIYRVIMTGESGQLTTTVTLDRVKPRLVVAEEKNRADITWLSGDIRECVLLKNKAVVSSGPVIYHVDQSGSYELQVYDHAGNMETAEFQVRYALNTGAILAILLIAALAVGGTFFFVNVNKKLKIR